MDIEKKGEELDFYKKEKISKIFDQHGAGFVLLPAGQKKPPDKKGWEKKQNQYSFQKAQNQRGKRNIGIVAGDGIIILDVDDPSALNGLDLPQTTKWETRPDRFAMYFRRADPVDALVKKGIHAGKCKLPLFNSQKLDETSRYAPVGEIKLERTYQVIPPSWKQLDGNRTEYRFLDGGEITPHPISLDWLLNSFQEIGICLSATPVGATNKGATTHLFEHGTHAPTHPGTMGTVASPGTEKNETSTNKPLAVNELTSIELEVSKLINTQEGDPNNQLNRSAFYLGLDGVDYNLARDVLTPVARSIGLDPQEFEPAIKRGFFAGMNQRIKEEGDAERESEPEADPSRYIEDGKVIPKLLADDIISDFIFKTTYGDHQIFFYDDGIYNDNGEDLICANVEKRLGKRSSDHITDEVTGHTRRSTLTKISEFNKYVHLLHLQNGIFNLDKMELEDFDEEILSTVRLPVRFVEGADCPRFNQFLKEILAPNDIPLIQEIFGWCLFKDYRYQKAVMCVGEGSNGKSTLLGVLKSFLGSKNTISISLQQLNRTFAPNQLFGKLANIYPDLPSDALRATGVFKALTGGDQISADVKYSKNFRTFNNYAKLIFSTNKIPESPDDSDAFFRRWLLINFPNKFEGGNKDEVLPGKLTTPEELSGIFTWAIEGAKRLVERGGFEYRETEKVREQYQRMASPLYAFVEDCIEVALQGWISKEDFYNNFVDYCKANNLPVIAKSVVGKKLPQYVCVEARQKRVGGERVRVWEGIKYKTEPTEEEEEEVEFWPKRAGDF